MKIELAVIGSRGYRIEASRSCSSQLGRKKSNLLLRNEQKASRLGRKTGRLAGLAESLEAQAQQAKAKQGKRGRLRSIRRTTLSNRSFESGT